VKSSLAQQLTAECLGTAFLLAAVVGSGIMAAKLAGGNGARWRFSATRFRPAQF
jgi:glycerol uptake facilitator-like aquaporin